MITLHRCAGLPDEEWAQDQDGRGEQLDDDVQRGPRRVLERVADRVARHGGLVRLGALAPVVAELDVLLRVMADATGDAIDGQDEPEKTLDP